MIAVTMAVVLALQQGSAAQDSTRQPNGRGTPVAAAARVSAAVPAPRIDGRLDDPIWALAQPLTEFTQQEPDDGAAPTERTEVRFAYDDGALYVAARMFESQPSLVAGTLSRRDNIDQSDHFDLAIDSYHDHQTTFEFSVNPAGVRSDATTTGDFENGDSGWDPVWEAAAARDSLGWTAEIRIPLSQLRFPSAPLQTWGIDFARYIHRKGETDMWAYFPRTAAGFASNFGHLADLRDLPQPRRLELLPYVAANEERLASGSPGNPFNDGSREVARAGLDAQYGLTSNLTLNATINPDFGQVEADPAVVNLTAYETFFQERRPFFVEGAGIFNVFSPGVIPANGPQFLYSRRIGRAPQGRPVDRGDAALADVPMSTTILGAAKLSGRTAGGWSLGLLEAATARERATVDSAGTRFSDEVEPFTNYAVVRAKNDFGRGTTTLGFTGTAVNRQIDDARLAFLRTAAYAGGVDFGHRFRQNAYSVFAAFGGSYVTGDRLAIQATQLSSARYYQRPDAHHVRYDSLRTSLPGWFAAVGAAKDQGPLQLGLGLDAWSPGFEINDLGAMSRVDRVDLMTRANRLWNRPGRLFRSAELGSQGGATWNFDGDRTGTWLYVRAEAELHNYWEISWGGQVNVRSINDALLRGGPAGISPAAWTTDVGVSTDYRRKLRFSLNVLGSSNTIGYRDFYVATSVAYRPTTNLSLSIGPSFDVSRTPQQYVAARPDPTATAMFGTRYIFGKIEQHTLDLTTRVDLTLSPALSIQLYVQPFIATGEYLDYRELIRPRSTDFLIYGQTAGSTDTPLLDGQGHVVAHLLDPDGAGPRLADTVFNQNFNLRSLRGNAVLRWEYRPGSTLFLVWTQTCSAFTPNPSFSATDDLGRLCQGRGNNVFAVKLNYWLSL